jgi:S-adenosylmethionine:tRNA ribosyltransferase-isomerase
MTHDEAKVNYSEIVEVDRLLTAYDYTLPADRIAQSPALPRDSARLLTVQNQTEQVHALFRDLPKLLNPGDLLVLNDTQVIPARLRGRKASGLPVEVLLLEPQPDDAGVTSLSSERWLALVKPGRRLKPGAQILFDNLAQDRVSQIESHSGTDHPGLQATVLATDPATAGRILQFELPEASRLEDLLQQLGQVPLPPYITNPQALPEQYQTVYAYRPGSAAAPTAGLHFTPELLDQLEAAGIDRAFVTLHIGVGTFRPVEAEDITKHQMHSEWVEVPAETVAKIHETKSRGGRVIAVGTTVVRSLEGAAQSGTLQPFCGKVDLFIYPGYQWKIVEGMITNFHLPKSSLMMLVSALIGRQQLLNLYQLAIDTDYRFYSFGDAMLILPEAVVRV